MYTKKLAQLNLDELYKSIPQRPDAKIKFDKNLTLGNIVTSSLNYIFALAGIALLVYLIMGGFTLMLAGGDPKKIQEGKGTISNALIGFVIVFVAFWLVQVLAAVLGLRPITAIFG